MQMIIYGVKFHIRDLIYTVLVTTYIYGFMWMALAVTLPLEQTIIEARNK